MNATLDRIIDDAMKLSAEEREELVTRLVRASEELPPMDPVVQAEAFRRLEEVKAGKSRLGSHDEMMARLRRKFPACS